MIEQFWVRNLYKTRKRAKKRLLNFGLTEEIIDWSCIILAVTQTNFKYRKVASSRSVDYSILETFGQRSQHKRIKFTLHNHSENAWMCY